MRGRNPSVRNSWFAITVLLIACAGGAPTQYAQGVPVAPSAPPFNPVTRSPVTVGQPGYAGSAEGLPRSHGRVLPETPETRKEPGIWASDKPEDPPDIFVIEDLLPPSAKNDARDETTFRVCERLMGRTFVKRNETAPGAVEDLRKSGYPIYHWRCIIAGLYKHCVDLQYNDKDRIPYWGDDKVKRYAEGIEERECSKGLSDKGKRTLHILQGQMTGIYNRARSNGEAL
jgi:hypothetical protein